MNWLKRSMRSCSNITARIRRLLGQQPQTRSWQSSGVFVHVFLGQHTSATLDKRTQNRVAVQLRKLSEEYGLASREMSLVAVVQRTGDRAGELPETRVVPVGMPHATRFEAYFGAMPLKYCVRSQQPTSSPAGPGDVFEQMFCTFSSGPASLPPSSPPLPSKNRRRDRPLAKLRNPFATDAARDPASATDTESPDDLLMDAAARVEPDRGMPGKDADERASATLIALLAFLSHGHTARAGAFRSHVVRLTSFIELSSRSIRPERSHIIAAVLALIDTGEVPSGDWLKLTKNPNNCWDEVGAIIKHKAGHTQLRLQ